MDPRRLFGNSAENVAARFLRKKGFKILSVQYKTRIGEIDLIAMDGDEVVFVEVKARRTDAFGHPEESVTHRKLEKIYLVGEQFLASRQWEQKPFRIDVIAMTYKNNDPEIVHLIGVS